MRDRSVFGAQGTATAQSTPRRGRRRVVVVVAAVLALGGLTAWLWDALTPGTTVYVVGDSITSLSQASIVSALTTAGYQPTIRATPGVKIGQAQNVVSTLALNQPWAWIIELGTDDAGANDNVWSEPFLAEWSAVSSAPCVVYVTVSPRAGPVAQQIDSSIERLARTHSNVHVLDWGDIEYQNPAWVTADGIHPTAAGQAALAAFETQALHRC